MALDTAWTSWKVVLAQAKAMKSNWLTACGGRAGRVRFQGANKCPAEGKDMNVHVYHSVKEFLKYNKYFKAKASNDSGSEDEQDHFNFETLNIG